MILIIIAIAFLVFEFIYYLFILSSADSQKVDYYREIPSKENPAIVGLMVKGNVDGNDLIATVLDLWKRGYINLNYQIINDREQCIVSDAEKDRLLALKDYENYLLDEMFKENKVIIFEEFINSPKFEIIFKNIGNMIKKRVDIKSYHKISKTRLINKVNFIDNYMLFGFSLFFSLFYYIINDFNISLLISCVVSLVLLLIFFLFKQRKKEIENVIMSYSIVIFLIIFGLTLSLTFISNYEYQYNSTLIILNFIASLFFCFSFVFGNYERKNNLVIIDIVYLIFSVIFCLYTDIVGISLCSLYFSHRAYIKSQKHVTFKDNNEVEKWLALKKFLNDFTVINQRTAEEIKIWDLYLIYAISLGVNKKIISEYLKLANIRLINNDILDKHYIENIDF